MENKKENLNVRYNMIKKYKNFLSNIDEGKEVGGLYLYGKNIIEERNETYEVEEYAKDYIGIGDDGGGYMFLMNIVTGDIIKTPMGYMNPTDSDYVTNIEKDWIKDLSDNVEMEEWEDDYCSRWGIYLKDNYTQNLKGLIQIKRVLGLSISSGELLKSSKNTPYLLKEYGYKEDAESKITKLGDYGRGLIIKQIDI